MTHEPLTDREKRVQQILLRANAIDAVVPIEVHKMWVDALKVLAEPEPILPEWGELSDAEKDKWASITFEVKPGSYVRGCIAYLLIRYLTAQVNP